MYTTSGWSSGKPEHKYYYYGCYNLSNEYGTRYILNNQSGGALITGYNNYYCTSPAWTVPPGYYLVVNITPINSVRVYSP
jgi:hypothetical protein